MERESERRKREKETGKLIDGRTDKNNLKDRWSDRQTDRQTDRHVQKQEIKTNLHLSRS